MLPNVAELDLPAIGIIRCVRQTAPFKALEQHIFRFLNAVTGASKLVHFETLTRPARKLNYPKRSWIDG